MSTLELAANAFTTWSIWLAARNSVHTWAVGIVGCILFAFQFFESRLYADVTLQVFFIATSVVGWAQWRRGRTADGSRARPVTRASRSSLVWMALAAAAVTAGYGTLLHRLTDAWMPYLDSAVLALSVVAQCLLMQRKIETWPAWLVVNTLAVPLFVSRELWLTAALYAAYWVNAWHGWWCWRAQVRADAAVEATAG